MHTHPHPGVAFEPDPALTGSFEVSLTRAVVPYNDPQGHLLPGGRIQDIGLGVVMDGSNPARSDVLDLGSAELRVVNLNGPLAVLGWLYPSGLRSLQRAVEDLGASHPDRARAFTFGMAVRTLQSVGFGPLTRPTLLRIGYRDICQDLDLHEGTAIRLLLASGSVLRLHLDYESVTLVARTGRSTRDPVTEELLRDAFPERDLLRGSVSEPSGAWGYHIPLPVPRSLTETRSLLGEMRRGLGSLLQSLDGERFRSMRELHGALGERDSLRTLGEQDGGTRPLERVTSEPLAKTGVRGVH